MKRVDLDRTVYKDTDLISNMYILRCVFFLPDLFPQGAQSAETRKRQGNHGNRLLDGGSCDAIVVVVVCGSC